MLKVIAVALAIAATTTVAGAQGTTYKSTAKPATQASATAKPHKPAVDMATEEGDGAAAKAKPGIAREPKLPATSPTATAPKAVGAKEPKPTVTATTKPAKKPAKVWVDPFAN